MQTPLPFAPSDPAPTIQLHHGDCLEVMPTLAPKSVDFSFLDIPYGVTSLAWDKRLNLTDLMTCLLTLQSQTSLQCFTAVQPIAADLICTFKSKFLYEMIWCKHTARGFQTAKRRPLKKHESVLLFGQPKHTYNAQMVEGKRYNHTGSKPYSGIYASQSVTKPSTRSARYPHTLLSFDESDLRHDTLNGHVSKRMHPTQKPVALLEWLIKTYTNPGDTVLDPVFGSATTAIACLRTGRNFIGIEKDAGFFEIGRKRIADEQARLGFAVTA